jgi:adenylate cyclase
MVRRFLSGENFELSKFVPVPWRLHFPKEQEKLFNEDYYQKTLPFAKLALSLALVMSLLLSLVEAILTTSNQLVLLLRLAVVNPVLGLVLFLLYLPRLKKLAPLLMCVAALAGNIYLNLTLVLTQPNELSYNIYQTLLILVVIATYAFLQLRFVYATVLGWLILLNYIALEVFGLNMLVSRQGMTQFFIQIFILIFANIMGMFISYSFELGMRRNFVQHHLLEQEQKKSERLLLNILPKEIATSLKNEPGTLARYHQQVSILFADVVNFTPLSSQLSPVALVELLNEMFSHFDTLVEKYNLEKIKTIGDCYMVASGVPLARPDHAHALANLALDMQAYINRQTFQSGQQLSLRIGLNSGAVVAGVIGHKKFSYDLWGDTVNTASRMESHGAKGKIQLTTATYELIKNEFYCEHANLINVKGKGLMEVWYLNGKAQSQAQPDSQTTMLAAAG